MPQALLARSIDFRTQARVNMLAAAVSAATAAICALLGFGVWTLVAAPGALYLVRAIGLALAGRWWITPSFRFKGAGATFGFGGAMLVSDLFWFVQVQSDVVIGGRMLDVHQLGLYTTALFLTQILVNKFVPALNEVAFPAYARLDDRAAVGPAFLKAVRVVMVAALPFYFGLAATAGPIVRTMLGDHWEGAVPVVRLLAFAMPFVTLHILYAPATNALGRPGIAARCSAAGAVIMPIAFLIGVDAGPTGMAWAWIAGFPLLLCVSSWLSLPVIGVRLRALAGAVLPIAAIAGAMAGIVTGLDLMLPPLPAVARLAVLVAAGVLSYAALMLVLARPLVVEVVGLIRRR
jgi:O-antigen/teichoic acid export membrane protein